MHFCQGKRQNGAQHPFAHPSSHGPDHHPRRFLAIGCQITSCRILRQPHKVDTTININANVLSSIGLMVCANLVLLCCDFTQVQSQCTLMTALAWPHFYSWQSCNLEMPFSCRHWRTWSMANRLSLLCMLSSHTLTISQHTLDKKHPSQTHSGAHGKIKNVW